MAETARHRRPLLLFLLLVPAPNLLLALAYGGGGEEGPTGGNRAKAAATRREIFARSAAAAAATVAGPARASAASPGASDAAPVDGPSALASFRTYRQRFPTLFDPIYGRSSRITIKRPIAPNVWALEQSLVLGPLETPLRCVVVKLRDGTLWVHAPLAPTEEFFELVEECAASVVGDDGESESVVSHVIVPTYALEHKVFAKDALQRWPGAQLWVSPGQFNFPVRTVPDRFVWGREGDGSPGVGLLGMSDLDDGEGDDASSSSSAAAASGRRRRGQPPWTDEIEYETLPVATFDIGGAPTPLYETAFYHRPSRTLIVTDAVAQIPRTPPPLNTPANLLLVSKRSTSDPMPDDTEAARQIGWEKTSLLVSYFFPEHEELDPESGLGVVTWTDGWHDNFERLAGRLLVPPVVRTLLYAQNPPEVRRWVDRITVGRGWDFVRIVPAHWGAPVEAKPEDLRDAFRFLEDGTVDAFPERDLQRGLRPIADFALGRLGRNKKD